MQACKGILYCNFRTRGGQGVAGENVHVVWGDM